MKIYNYSNLNGEFLFVSDAVESPLEPGVYLIPACATPLEPLELTDKNQVNMFNGDSWEIVPDLRGTKFWIDNVEYTMNTLGTLPENASVTPPEDHRGTIYWMPDYSEHTMDILGSLPEGATTTKPEDNRGIYYWMPDYSEHIMDTLGPFPKGASVIKPEDNRGILFWMPDNSQYMMTTLGPLPEGATTVKPEDHRGVIYWMPDYSVHVMDDFGPLPEGATTVKPEDHRGVRYWLADYSDHVMDKFGPLPDGASTTPPEDHRGTKYWLNDVEYTMDKLGPLPEGISMTPPLTIDDVKSDLSNKINQRLDAVANSWNYNGFMDAISYVSSTNPEYAADAQELLKWRDTVRAWSLNALPSVTVDESDETFFESFPLMPSKPEVSS